MGEVYRALDTHLRRDVALKLLPESDQSDPDRMLRLVREGRAIASLDHPYIAAVHSLEEVDGFQFLVLELVSGDAAPLAIATVVVFAAASFWLGLGGRADASLMIWASIPLRIES